MEWLELVNMTADEAMAATASEERRTGKPDATAFLEDVLAGGPLPSTVEERAAQRGISEGQLEAGSQAARGLGREGRVRDRGLVGVGAAGASETC